MTATRILPEKPHLDHLRAEAKHRHATMKSMSQSARLSDAQFLVARDYGFSNWMSLKAEVDRRRLLSPDATPQPLRPLRLQARPRRRDQIAALASSATAEQALFPATLMGMVALQFGGPLGTLLRMLLG